MNEISLKLVTRVVEAKTISTRFKIVVDKPVFEMSQSVYYWYITKIKNKNFVSRLKNRSL